MQGNDIWKLTESGNYIMTGQGYFISYNPSTKSTLKKKQKKTLEDYGDDYDTEETALYIEKIDTWLILDGDFRLEYSNCNNVVECISVYMKYELYHKSKWSTV